MAVHLGRALAAVFVLVGGALPAPAPGPGPGPGPAPALDGRPVDGIRVDGITVPPPARGESVWVEAVSADGRTRVVGVTVRGDGTVVLRRSGPPPQLLLSGGDPCRDPAFAVDHRPWRRELVWWFRARRLPPGLSARAAEEALLGAAASLAEGRNDCGLQPQLEVPMAYRGRTDAPLGVGLTGCLSRDRRSVVGFGPLALGYLALTCWWVGPKGPLEADVKLSDAYPWTTDLSRPCWGRWSVEAVAVHELGHVLGLGHVGEAAHGALTMSPVIHPCQAEETTLGLGDVLGLERLYRPT
ncbi:MAG TPA: matrixin family metalloprotease [Actinomycetota bacterium]|nr:matrixin family metalloprotease [Actinomycetota bacterium]